MTFNKLTYNKINETVYSYKHTSGLNTFVIPKKGYSKKFAAVSIHYGSINNEFIIPGEKSSTKVPDGLAHFLEHKLFEQKDGNMMKKFSALGAKSNAATTFNQTVFMFSCISNFSENFRLLLELVQNPYITQKGIEKERGIIIQEILMFRDNPYNRALNNLLDAFYTSNPVKRSVTGTIESISTIDKEVLNKCYKTFYHPSNMAVIVIGDVEPIEVFEQIDADVQIKGHQGRIINIFPTESSAIAYSYAEQKLPISIPVFEMGFKDNMPDINGIESIKHEAAVKLILDMLIGRSSELYNELYNESLLNTTFKSNYTIEECYAFSRFGGESSDPLKVMYKTSEVIASMRKSGLNKANYERIKKAHVGKFLRQLNYVESISRPFISAHFKGANLFEYMDIYKKITFEYINKIFYEHFNLDNLALSIIKPI